MNTHEKIVIFGTNISVWSLRFTVMMDYKYDTIDNSLQSRNVLITISIEDFTLFFKELLKYTSVHFTIYPTL